jgi:hypothetical protein
MDTTAADVERVERAVEVVLAGGSVLPRTELSGFHGYPIVEWSIGVADRLQHGFGPMLDRPTLSLWESWPPGVDSAPPVSPLTIVGFASTASWQYAYRAARELRGFGATLVVTDTKPGPIRLADADISGVYVVTTNSDGAHVLVHGRPSGGTAPRMVATRYWEERLLAHALATGVPIPRHSPTESPWNLW